MDRQIGVVVVVDDDSTSVTRWLRYKTRVAFQIGLNCLLSLEDKNLATCAVVATMYRWHNWTTHSHGESTNFSTLFCVLERFCGGGETIGTDFGFFLIDRVKVSIVKCVGRIKKKLEYLSEFVFSEIFWNILSNNTISINRVWKVN